MNTFKLYLSRQASSLGRYILEQVVLGLFGWVPSVVGIGLRAFAYRLIMRLECLNCKHIDARWRVDRRLKDITDKKRLELRQALLEVIGYVPPEEEEEEWD